MHGARTGAGTTMCDSPQLAVAARSVCRPEVSAEVQSAKVGGMFQGALGFPTSVNVNVNVSNLLTISI